MKKISIVAPCLNEEKYIRTFLMSIYENGYNREDFEIIIVDGNSNDNTLKEIESFKNDFRDCDLTVLKNDKKFTPISMNIGIKHAKYEYIIITGIHSFYPPNYFNHLLSWFDKLDADCIGGVWNTEVLNKTLKSNAIKLVLTNKFGVGNGLFRIGVNEPTLVDTVPFGCYKKEVFEKIGYMDERLIRNQDIEFNKRLAQNGGKVYLVPDVSCTYYARETYIPLAKNNFKNGYWNPLTLYYTKNLRSLSVRHFIPLLFILSLTLPILLTPLMFQLVWITILSLSSYITLIILISLKLKKEDTNFFYIIVSFIVLHISYGIGSIVGITSVIKKYLKVKNESK